MTRWSLFLQTLSLLHHFLGLYSTLKTPLTPPLLSRKRRPPIKAVLELGSGGGNNASHLKANFQMTLSDLSPAMLDLSRTINPECEHVQGDMRTLRLGRVFDAIFVEDAVMYLTSVADLRAMLAARPRNTVGECLGV